MSGYSPLVYYWFTAKRLFHRLTGYDASIKNLPFRNRGADNHIICSHCSFSFGIELHNTINKFQKERVDIHSRINVQHAQSWFYNFYPEVECPKCKRHLDSCFTTRINNVVATLLWQK